MPLVTIQRESAGLPARFLLVVFCLVAALLYRVSVSVVPSGVFESLFLLILSAMLLLVALFARTSKRLQKYCLCFLHLPYAHQ